MATRRLFAYGLLMRGMRYHDSHMAGNVSRIRSARAEGRLVYLEQSDMPALLPGDDIVYGEVFDLDEQLFEKLDYLFGFVPGQPERSEFVRRRVEVTTDDGEVLEVFTYFLRAAVLRTRFRSAYEIPGGDWRRFLETRDDD